jgi:hypothetical protein
MTVRHSPHGSVLERARVEEFGPAAHLDDRVDENPKIVLGRREFAVPEFTWRELKKLMPAMRRCWKIDFGNLTEDDMNSLGELMWLVVHRSGETFYDSYEAFEMLPIRLPEILAAIPIIARQAGMEAAKAGEA